MGNFPSLTGKALLTALRSAGFQVVRIKGSHHFIRHDDGRCSVVPVHANEEIGVGLPSKILRDCDLGRDELLRNS